MPLSLDTPAFTRVVLLRSTVVNNRRLQDRLRDLSSTWALACVLLTQDNYERLVFSVLGRRTGSLERMILAPDQRYIAADYMAATRDLFHHLKLNNDPEWRSIPMSSFRTGTTSVICLRYQRRTVTVPASVTGEETRRLSSTRSVLLSNGTLVN